MYLTGTVLLAISGIYGACNNFDFDLDSKAVIVWMHWAKVRCHSLLAATASTSSQVWATASDRNCFDARENVAVYRSISRPAYGEVKTVKRRIFKHVFLYTWVNFLVLPIKQWCIRRVYQLRRLLSAFQLNLELTCHIFQLLEMESCQGICVMYCTIIITLYTRHNTQIKTIEKKIRNGQSQKRKYDKIHYSTETSSMTVIILSGWNMQISMTLV